VACEHEVEEPVLTTLKQEHLALRFPVVALQSYDEVFRIAQCRRFTRDGLGLTKGYSGLEREENILRRKGK